MTRRRGARFGATALLVIVIVVVGSAGAGSPVAAGQTPPVVPTAPTTPRGTVSYLLHASFAIGYGVEWSEEQGDPETEWVPWRVDSGTNEMHAGTYVTKKNGGIEDVWIPGHAAIYPRPLRTGRQEGGPHSRPSAKSHRNPPPEMDSGGRLELDAQLRKRRPRTLPAVSERLCRGPRARVHHEERGRARRHASRDVDGADRPGAIRETGARRAKMPAIALYVAGTPPYQRCKNSGLAAEIVPGIGLLLPPQKRWVTALRRLKPGRRVNLRGDYSGTCARDIGDRSSCEFTLTIRMTIVASARASRIRDKRALGLPGRLAAFTQIRSGTTPRASRAWRAASCSAAFFVDPLPAPSCSPATYAAQTNRRSCAGPSTSSTV